MELISLDSPEDLTFFECPRCHRNFTRKGDGTIFFRWGHSITLLLYPVIFELHPGELCEQVATKFVSDNSVKLIQRAIEEVRLELDYPAQSIRDTVDCRAEEHELIAYLRCIADMMKTRITQPYGPQPNECTARHLDSGISGLANRPKHCSLAYFQAENDGFGMDGSLVTMNGSGPNAT